jgi:hypothetical protein
MAMHLTFNKTSPPMQLDDTAQVSAETFDGFKLVFNDVQKRTLDPVATIDADGKDVTVSVYKALVKHHAGVTDWSDGYPQMTGGELAILYNHVLDLLRKNSFDKTKSFRILRMRDACFTPPGSVDAPTTSRDAFAMMVSRAPRCPRCLHSLPPAATPVTIRRFVQVVPEAQLDELHGARHARAGGRAAQDAPASPLAARPAQVRGRRG